MAIRHTIGDVNVFLCGCVWCMAGVRLCETDPVKHSLAVHAQSWGQARGDSPMSKLLQSKGLA